MTTRKSAPTAGAASESSDSDLLARSVSTGAVAPTVLSRFPAMLYGGLLLLAGLGVYLCGVLLAFANALLRVDPAGASGLLSRHLVWYSGIPVVFGLILTIVDLYILLPRKRRTGSVFCLPLKNPYLTVVLTAYDDELSIAHAVRDFRSHPLVRRVLVIDNNSSDATPDVAAKAGAIVVLEERQGYGHCVHRGLAEAAAYEDTDLTLLCEGDMTFRAYDINKFLAYIAHADIVNGTRIVEQLREHDTQLTTSMYYGNFFVGKLLETKHLGKGTFTDVGTTYKLCRNAALRRLLPVLNPQINLEFNAHFLDVALRCGWIVVECPVTFFRRLGRSKGGNVSNMRAMKVGLRMIVGLVLGWRWVSTR